MSTNNHMQITGNLTADPELRYTNATPPKPVVNFRVATDERILDGGEWVSRPTFINVVAFGSLADNASDLHTGDRVVVAGRYQTRSYEPTAGDKRYYSEIVADEIAASLKFASVEITKNTPSTGSVDPGGDPVYGDEEPF